MLADNGPSGQGFVDQTPACSCHSTTFFPNLLILDDLGLDLHLDLHRLTAQQSANIYNLILNRHRASSFIITSSRAVGEMAGPLEDPILGNSAAGRLANASYQIVIESTSYRERQSPHRAVMSAAECG